MREANGRMGLTIYMRLIQQKISSGKFLWVGTKEGII